MDSISAIGAYGAGLQASGYYGLAAARTYASLLNGTATSQADDSEPSDEATQTDATSAASTSADATSQSAETDAEQAVLSVVAREMLQDQPYIDAVTIELRMPAPKSDNSVLDVKA